MDASKIVAVTFSVVAGERVNTVNARELHAFLGVGKVFAAWIKDRISQYDFVENRDFVCFPILESKEGRGGHNQIDYHLTLDMAKELCMVERNDRGRQARQYFIECERALRDQPALNPANMSRMQLLQMAMEAEQERLALEGRVQAMKPDVDAFARIAGADGSLCITDAAKALQMAPKRLIEYMAQHGWIYRRHGGGNYLGYQSRVVSGDVTHKVTSVTMADGSERITEQVRVTPKGLANLAKKAPGASVPEAVLL